MYLKNGQTGEFVQQFHASGVGATGLTVTAKVWELRTDGSKSPNDTTGTTATVTEIGGGAYRVRYTATADCVPVAVFSTAGTADIKTLATSSFSLVLLDASVSSRNAVAPDNASITAIKAKTDNLPTDPAAVGSAMTLTPAERTEVANEVERQIIDDTDTEKVLAAILAKVEGMPVTADTLAIAEGVRVVMERVGGTLDDIYGRTPADPAGQAALDAARDAIIAAMPDIPPPDDGVEITQDTIGTDGDPIGRVQPYAEVTVYRDGVSEHQFKADADGDFGYKLPEGSVWVLIARRPPQYLPMTAEVAT